MADEEFDETIADEEEAELLEAEDESEEPETEVEEEQAEEPAQESKPVKEKKTKKAPAKKAAAKKAPAKKAAAETKSTAPRKVGIADAILTACQRAEGATTSEILDILTKKFKDRDPAKMRVTIQHQVRDLGVKYEFEMKKSRVEDRGLVYKAPVRIAGFKPVEL